jgi:hypothetical protein
MSPRKNNLITIEPWPNPKQGKLYKGFVRKVEKKAKCIQVSVENLDPTQLGRIHEKTLLLPAHPGNGLSRFLTACGMDTDTIGTTIGPDDIAGATIGMRFGPVAQDGSQEVDFERIEDSPGTQPESPVEDSGGQTAQQEFEPQ